MPMRYGMSVVAIGIGIGLAGASGQAVAWAAPGASDSSGTSGGSVSGSTSGQTSGTSGQTSGSSTGQAWGSSTKPRVRTGHGPKKPAERRHGPRQGRSSIAAKTAVPDSPAPGPDPDEATPPATETPTSQSPAEPPASTSPQPETATERLSQILRSATQNPGLRAGGPQSVKPEPTPRAEVKRLAALGPSTLMDSALAPSLTPMAAKRPTLPDLTEIASAAPSIPAKTITLVTPKAAAVTSPTTPTAPSEPEPLSPIAKIAALPGRIVNSVLEVLDITTSANGPDGPLNFAPINDALFAAFREIEDRLGLTKPPAMQEVPPKLVYDGPTIGKTPTVSQFLNAATAAYVFGGTPGDLKPFVVDGKQMESTNVLTGMSAKAWVTPEGQIIIAYQGTTGGTNLLHNPLIAVSQVITDMQVIFTDTTPEAFTDALAFQQEVEAAAVAQGYRREDIFLTGHSLGGWEASYVAQQTGLGGIAFESPGLNTTVPGNGANSGFVNILTYGDTAAYFSTDLPGLQPFMPYVPGGGSKPHYGSIVMIGNPDAAIPLMNSAALLSTGPIGAAIFVVDIAVNFLQYHLPGIQAYHLGVTPDPGVVPWLGYPAGPVNADYAGMTIPELQKAASDAGTLIKP